MLLLQEFDVGIRNKKGAENVVVDHLNRLEREVDPMPIQDEFPDEQILQMTHAMPCYANISCRPRGKRTQTCKEEKLEFSDRSGIASVLLRSSSL
ncbi:hypothetical protein CR513_55913, partial [Mucuna pruriens]